MKHRIQHIAPHTAAKTVALAVFVSGILLTLFVIAVAILVFITSNIGLTTISYALSRLQLFHVPLSLSGLIALIFNGLLGVAIAWYALVILLCYAYNLVAHRLGGIEIDIDTCQHERQHSHASCCQTTQPSCCDTAHSH